MNGRIIDSLLVEKYCAKAKDDNAKLQIDDKFKRNMYKELIKSKEKLSATGADTVYIFIIFYVLINRFKCQLIFQMMIHMISFYL